MKTNNWPLARGLAAGTVAVVLAGGLVSAIPAQAAAPTLKPQAHQSAAKKASAKPKGKASAKKKTVRAKPRSAPKRYVSVNPVRAKAPHILAKFGCPGTPVHYSAARLGRYANGGYDPNNGHIHLRPGMPVSRITYVTAHECMHKRQHRAYREDWSRLQRDTNKVFGGYGYQGLERAADCMTRARGINVRNQAYSSSCSGAKQAATRKLLAGKRIR